MLTSQGVRASVKVVDFGIASVVEEARDEDYLTLTTRGMVHGTPAYMSPEQLKQQPVDGRSDIYAWGLVLAEVLTGEQVMRADSLAEIVAMHLAREPVPLSATLLNGPLGEVLRMAVSNGHAEIPMAPRVFWLELATQQGSVQMEIQRAWPPDAVDRLYHLAQHGFFERTPIVGLEPGTLFGLHPRLRLLHAWGEATLPVSDASPPPKPGFVVVPKVLGAQEERAACPPFGIVRESASAMGPIQSVGVVVGGRNVDAILRKLEPDVEDAAQRESEKTVADYQSVAGLPIIQSVRVLNESPEPPPDH